MDFRPRGFHDELFSYYRWGDERKSERGGTNNECFMKKKEEKKRSSNDVAANLHERATYFDIFIQRICTCNF